MKIIRIIAVEIRKYFKNTDVLPKKNLPKICIVTQLPKNLYKHLCLIVLH